MDCDRLGHVSALDGIRGIAIAGVLLLHVYGLRGGYLGVDVFFVLSGFLITTLLLEEWAGRASISLRGFYRRRALRLLPALVAVSVVASVQIIPMFLVPSTRHDAARGAAGLLGCLFYAGNLI